MRIALACSNFPPEFLGGTERVVLALARGLRERGDEVIVLAGSDRPHVGEDVVRERFEGFDVRRLPRLPDEVYGLDLRRPRLQARCEELLRSERIELLHVHHWALLTTGLVRAARDLGIATVATLHDMWTTCPRFFRRPPDGVTCPTGDGRESCVRCALLALTHLDEPTVRAGLRSRDAEVRAEIGAAQVVTAPSEACRVRIERHLPWHGPIEVVPHGLLEPVGQHSPLPARAGVVRVGTFGNLVEEKGVMLLVWACRNVPDLELHLFGRFLDPEFERLVRAKAAEFGVPLACHGPYEASGPHPARALDLAVFPSLCEETYGLVVEEALARGVPVVVSDRGALAERIGTGGLVVSVNELGPLERTLSELCRHPERIAELRTGIPVRFATIEDAAARYRSIYSKALQEATA